MSINVITLISSIVIIVSGAVFGLFIGRLLNKYRENKDNIVYQAKKYATKSHRKVNHKYDKKPYSFHLSMVYEYGLEFSYLLPLVDVQYVLAACWLHDVIEDCRKTFNDIFKIFGVRIADIVYAVSNEKGKTREARANNKYYQGIRNVLYADYVKICDRLGNVKHSKDTKSSMFDKYRKEYPKFKEQLYNIVYDDMFVELERLLEL